MTYLTRLFLVVLLLCAFALPAAGAPVVVSVSPPDGATDVAATVQPSAIFDQAMDPASVTDKTLTVSQMLVIKSIAAGGDHTVALKKDGTVVAWGNGPAATIPAGLDAVTAIAAGGYHTVALKNDGTVIGWGSSKFGSFSIPAGLNGVTAIAAGWAHTVALKNDGTVQSWGVNANPIAVPPGLNGVTAIAAGSHTVALKNDGSVVAWGNNDYGQTTIPAGLSGVTAIAAGYSHTVALKSDGTVVAWGDNRYGQTAIPAGLKGVTAIATGSAHTIVLKNDGTVVAWGDNGYGQTGIPAGLDGVAAIAAGSSHTTVLKNDGTLMAWGRNNYGQSLTPTLNAVTTIAAGGHHIVALKKDGTAEAWGDDSAGQNTIPAGLSRITAIATSDLHAVALKEDGTVVAWGSNYYGQSTVPIGLSGVTAIAAGDTHTVALKDDGTVVAWGDNYLGRSTIPNGLNGVIAISARGHTVALKDNGTVVAWGDNAYGQTEIPAGLSEVTSIAAGDTHTVALKSDGTVVAWGNNYSGQTTIPAGLNGVIAIAAGGSHTVALKSDGTVVTWGDGLGINVPAGLYGVAAIAAGANETVALKNDGTVVAWGYATTPLSPYETSITGTVIYDQTNRKAIFRPATPLPQNGLIKARVNTGVLSQSGVHPAADYSWTFRVLEMTVPGAPSIANAVAGNGQATVSLSAPVSNGNSPIIGYTVTSSPAGGIDNDAGSTSLTHLITSLNNGTAYTFTAVATNAAGAGPPSAASNSVTPTAPGVCGPSNAGTYYSAPISDLCSVGTPSAVTGTGPWSWSCSSQACSAHKSAASANPVAITTPPTAPNYPNGRPGTTFNIFRSDAGGPFVQIVSNTTSTSYTDMSPLRPNTLYQYAFSTNLDPAQTVFMNIRTPLFNGWNIVAVPFDTSGVNPSTLFGSPVSSLFEWVPNGASPENSNAVVGAYRTVSSLTPGKGYFTKASNGATTLAFNGNAVTGTTSVTLKPGWNMIGNPSTRNKGDIGANWFVDGIPLRDMILTNRIGGAVYWWNGSTYDSWSIIGTNPQIEPWKGYWILNLDSVNHILSMQ